MIGRALLPIFCLALGSSPAWAETLGGAAAPDLHIGRVIVVFLLCCGLAIGAAVVIKRNAKGGFGQASALITLFFMLHV